MTGGWMSATLNDLCVVDWGNTNLTKKAYVADGKFLAVSAAGCDGRIGHKEHAKHTPVLSAIGAQCGKMFFPREDFTAIKNTITLTPRNGTCDGHFLYYLLTFVDLPQRGAGQPFISKGDVQKFHVSFPPFAEQRQIAQLLSAVQRGIERQERLIALSAELKKTLMHKLFTEGTRGEMVKQTEIGPMPGDWKVKRLDARYETKLGKMLSQKAHTGAHARNYLRNKNVQWGRIDLTDLLQMDFDEKEREKFELRLGDLLVCEGGEPGRAALWGGTSFECYYQKALHRVRPLGADATNEYLLWWLMYAIRIRNLYGTGGASSTIAHLPVAQLSALRIPFPTRDEQDQISSSLNAIAAIEEIRMRAKIALEALFRTLLHQLMSSRIRVNDIDLSILN